MGKIPQDGENGQNVAFFIFWSMGTMHLRTSRLSAIEVNIRRLASSFYEVLKPHNLYFCFVLWVVVALSCSTVKTIKGGAGLNEMQKWDSSTCVFALVQHLSGRLICIDYGVVRG